MGLTARIGRARHADTIMETATHRVTALAALPQAGDVLLVPIEQLSVDPRYQRELDEGWVGRKVAQGWDDALSQEITVNVREDGTVVILDGQHRVALAALLRVNQVRARVHYGLSLPEEARLFDGLNWERKQPKRTDHWRALVEAGDPAITALDAVVRECGFRVGKRSSRAAMPNVIGCPGVLERIGVGKSGAVNAERLREVLEFVRGTWPDEPLAISSGVLEGVALFLRRYGGLISRAEASRKLALVPPTRLVRHAAVLRDAEGTGEAAAVCKALQVEYDKGRRAGRIGPAPAGEER